MHSQYCAIITTVHRQNFFIIPSRIRTYQIITSRSLVSSTLKLVDPLETSFKLF